MDADVYPTKAVGDFYNATFVNVKVDMEKGEGMVLAQQYAVTAYPSFLFIDGDGKVVHKGRGLLTPDEFLTLGKDASNPETRYGSLRAKAPSMTPIEFTEFSRKAMEFGDSEYDNIAKAFLARQPDILANKELVDIVMRGITYLDSEKSLAYIIENKARITALGSYPENMIYQRIIGLTLAYAVETFTDKSSGAVDLKTLDQFLRKYIPKDAFYMSNFFQTEHYLTKGDADKAKEAYMKVLDDRTQDIEFGKICQMISTFGAQFPAEVDLQKSFAVLDNYPLKPAEESSAFLRNMVKGLVYLKIQDMDKFKLYSEKLLSDPNAPDSVKQQLRMMMAQQGL